MSLPDPAPSSRIGLFDRVRTRLQQPGPSPRFLLIRWLVVLAAFALMALIGVVFLRSFER